ncbi:MAG: hypothetical protein KDK40_01960 [Chlamydiia bacterium]|nr:hypothetical protein [Chlamydiia bacterium]
MQAARPSLRESAKTSASSPYGHFEGIQLRFLSQLKRSLHRQSLFHCLFLLLLGVEASLLVRACADEGALRFVSVYAAILSFTGMSWAILNTYRKNSRRNYLNKLFERTFGISGGHTQIKSRGPDHHISQATNCYRLFNALKGFEESTYSSFARLPFLGQYVDQFSRYLHGDDLFAMREILLTRRVEEHRQLVIVEPTSLEVHTALAGSYVDLSQLYFQEQMRHRSGPLHAYCLKHFHRSVSKATEEFRILEVYAKDDPWVYMQLAYSYRDLKMPEKELKQYERLFSLRPRDKEVAFTLGKLYFQHGHSAKGLATYERLLELDSSLARSLILHY